MIPATAIFVDPTPQAPETVGRSSAASGKFASQYLNLVEIPPATTDGTTEVVAGTSSDGETDDARANNAGSDDGDSASEEGEASRPSNDPRIVPDDGFATPLPPAANKDNTAPAGSRRDAVLAANSSRGPRFDRTGTGAERDEQQSVIGEADASHQPEPDGRLFAWSTGAEGHDVTHGPEILRMEATGGTAAPVFSGNPAGSRTADVAGGAFGVSTSPRADAIHRPIELDRNPTGAAGTAAATPSAPAAGQGLIATSGLSNRARSAMEFSQKSWVPTEKSEPTFAPNAAGLREVLSERNSMTHPRDMQPNDGHAPAATDHSADTKNQKNRATAPLATGERAAFVDPSYGPKPDLFRWQTDRPGPGQPDRGLNSTHPQIAGAQAEIIQGQSLRSVANATAVRLEQIASRNVANRSAVLTGAKSDPMLVSASIAMTIASEAGEIPGEMQVQRFDPLQVAHYHAETSGPAHRAELARAPIAQAVEILARQQERTVEISVRPEELGRVRMSLTTTETGVTMVVTTERPETLDLMRRHIDQLAQELRRMGYDDIGFDFHRDGAGQDSRQEQHRTGGAIHEVAVPPTVPDTARLALPGLDLRL